MKEIRLVNLTGFGAWNSDVYRDLVFNEVWKKIIGTIAGRRLLTKIPVFISPEDPVIEKKQIDFVPLGMSYFG